MTRCIPAVAFAAAAVLLFTTTAARAHTGDHSFLEIPFEQYLAEADRRSSDPRRVERSARTVGTLLSVLTNEDGETILPRGTMCDRTEVRDGTLAIYFTLPEGEGAPLSEGDPDNVGMVLRHLCLPDDSPIGIEFYARRPDDTIYEPIGYFVREYTELGPIPEPEVGPEEPAGTPGPDYQQVYRALRGEDRPSPDTTRIAGASPLATASQPAGGLSGRTVFVGAGHGYRWNGSSWGLERARCNHMNEDHGNVDQANFLATYLFNAGATVVCFRPLGNQPNEVVMDDNLAVLTGSWSTSSGSTNFNGSARFATANATESATARYTPNIPAAGFYPVYCWANQGNNRVPGQVYRILHTGGTSEVRVNHRRVGNGWIWLGEYYFEAGSNPATGSVVVSNVMPPGGTAGQVVMADCIRFGNGFGDFAHPNGNVSGFLREREGNAYWIHNMRAPTSVINVNITGAVNQVGSPPRMSAYMRRDDGQGYNGDIYLGFHSNAAGSTCPGAARGAVGLINSSTNGGTPVNQAAFAEHTRSTLHSDAVAEAINWEIGWGSARSNYTSGFGEISNSNLGGEMCGTIIETAFHDNVNDALLMRDPKVRNVMGRSQYRAVLRYFNQFDSGPLVYLPEPPQRARATNLGNGSVRIAWTAPPTGGANGASATSYRVYRSTNGFGFGNPVATSATSIDIAGLPTGQTTYFRVSAVNAGGESLPTASLAVRVSYAASPVLIVNAYNRLDRHNNIPQIPGAAAGTEIERIFLRRNNSYDYVRFYAAALTAANRVFDTCSKEAVSSGDISLAGYHTVIWCLGEEKGRTDAINGSLTAAERTALQNFANGGGNLFLSGSEVARELGGLGMGSSFLNTVLRAAYVADSAETYQAAGAAGSVLSGLGTVTFDNGANVYNVDSPDVISVFSGGAEAMTYVGGVGGGGGTTLIHAFDTLSGWQDPNFSGQTNADNASTFQIVSSPRVEGTGSGELFYVWGAGNFIREYNSSLPQFPKDTNFSIFVHGDNSQCQIRFAFRDPVDNEIFITPYTTVNWTGWQEMTATISTPGLTRWAGSGDNVFSGANAAFDSIQVSKASSSFTQGFLYFDNATYSTGGGGGGSAIAAVQYAGAHRVLYIAFPFEAILNGAQRESLMSSALTFFGTPAGVVSTVADWRLY